MNQSQDQNQMDLQTMATNARRAMFDWMNQRAGDVFTFVSPGKAEDHTYEHVWGVVERTITNIVKAAGGKNGELVEMGDISTEELLRSVRDLRTVMMTVANQIPVSDLEMLGFVMDSTEQALIDNGAADGEMTDEEIEKALRVMAENLKQLPPEVASDILASPERLRTAMVKMDKKAKRRLGRFNRQMKKIKGKVAHANRSMERFRALFADADQVAEAAILLNNLMTKPFDKSPENAPEKVRGGGGRITASTAQLYS